MPAQSGFRFLNEGPLNDKVGDVFDTWSADGDIGLDISIGLPVDSRSDNSAVSEKGLQGETVNRLHVEHQDVAIQFNGNNISLANHRIDLQSTEGKLFFNAQKGLSTEKVTATVFGEPIHCLLYTSPSPRDRG